jgi:hypothetical protein
MKIIFDQYSLLLRTALTTAKEGKPPSMPVLTTAMHVKSRFPYQYSLLTSKNLPRDLRE